MRVISTISPPTYRKSGCREMDGINNINRAAAFSGKADEKAELKKAAVEFESMFINQLLKVMRETVEKSELFHGGSGEEIYTSLFDTELSREIASSGGIGLDKILLDQLARNESAPDKPDNNPLSVKKAYIRK